MVSLIPQGTDQSGSQGILAEDLESYVTELREQFRDTNLPIDWDMDLLNPEVEDFHEKPFVHQLRLVQISDRRIRIAVRDYLRAFTQRSRWSRDGLLLAGELDRYERRLFEEWERVFERMRDELGTEAAEEQKLKAAQELYAWVESTADFAIRPDCSEPFVARGTYHILSDDLRVGWHPDFFVRLMALFEPTVPDGERGQVPKATGRTSTKGSTRRPPGRGSHRRGSSGD